MHILDTESEGLFTRLQRLSPSAQWTLLLSAFAKVAKGILESADQLQQVLDTLVEGKQLDDETLEYLRRVAHESDEEYFRLEELGKAEEALKHFGKARLATAVLSAVQLRSAEGAADAINELCKACDDPREILRVIDAEVDSLRLGQ